MNLKDYIIDFERINELTSSKLKNNKRLFRHYFIKKKRF